MANSIIVKNHSNVFEEYDAVAAITPGMLIELTSAGKVQAHSNAEQNALPMFALENELEGEDISDAYAADDNVRCWIPNRGDQVRGILADGQTVVIGDFLESNGAGYLQKHVADTESFESNEAGEITVYPNAIVGIALEAVDISGSSGEESENAALDWNQRIKIRVI
jgi:hypothetical protein